MLWFLRRHRFRAQSALRRLLFVLLKQMYLAPHSAKLPAFAPLGWHHHQSLVCPKRKFADFLCPQRLSAAWQLPAAPISHRFQHEWHGRHPSPKRYATFLRISSRPKKPLRFRLLFRILSNGQLLLRQSRQTGSSTF